jgi:hypothetical protein
MIPSKLFVLLLTELIRRQAYPSCSFNFEDEEDLAEFISFRSSVSIAQELPLRLLLPINLDPV